MNLCKVSLHSKRSLFMSDQAAGVFVTVDAVIPRLSPSGSGWEVLLIQRNKQPYLGMWALHGGHLNIDDLSLEAAAQREHERKPVLTSLCTSFNKYKPMRILKIHAESMFACSTSSQNHS